MGFKCTLAFSIVSLVLGTALLVVGRFGKDYVIMMRNETVQKNVLIKEDSPVYPSFMLSESHASFYLFNIKNPKDVQQGEQIEVEEVGPFVYRMVEEKTGAYGLNNNKQIAYDKLTTYHFVPEKSVGDPKDFTVTVINIPLISLLFKARHTGWMSKQLLAAALKAGFGTSVTMTHTVEELLWGYKDPLLSFLTKFDKTINPMFNLGRNTTKETDSVMSTGVGDVQDVGKYTFFDGKDRNTCWNTEEANTPRGTDGTRTGPFVSKERRLEVYVSNMFRALDFEYRDETAVFGLQAWRFGMDVNNMKSAYSFPNNRAYNAFGPSGVLNITACANVPIFFSKPHFLGGDEFYTTENVKGLAAVQDKHDSLLYIEPVTGNTVGAQKRLQVNIQVDTSDWPGHLAGKMRYALVPVLWQAQEKFVDEEKAHALMAKLHRPVEIAEQVQKHSVPAGGILLAVGLLLLGFACCNKRVEQGGGDNLLLDFQCTNSGRVANVVAHVEGQSIATVGCRGKNV
eukprot:GDKI01026563.1.p1 GENE.GDKI01026563.1~~GDKI01026563.1.p1  ORF type:complete len:531 (-),score=143.65 GDKI01026563.1:23-1555(-)